MKTPPYQTAEGLETTADDPQRLLWFSSNCGYWTDDWSKLKRYGPGIPCCPHCSCVGMQITAEAWDKGAEEFQAKECPRYVEWLAGSKETCSKVKFLDRYAAWIKEQPK